MLDYPSHCLVPFPEKGINVDALGTDLGRVPLPRTDASVLGCRRPVYTVYFSLLGGYFSSLLGLSCQFSFGVLGLFSHESSFMSFSFCMLAVDDHLFFFLSSVTISY